MLPLWFTRKHRCNTRNTRARGCSGSSFGGASLWIRHGCTAKCGLIFIDRIARLRAPITSNLTSPSLKPPTEFPRSQPNSCKKNTPTQDSSSESVVASPRRNKYKKQDSGQGTRCRSESSPRKPLRGSACCGSA